MRWGDSDSSDEDEIRVSSLPAPRRDSDDEDARGGNSAPRRSDPLPSARGGGKGYGGEGGQRNNRAGGNAQQSGARKGQRNAGQGRGAGRGPSPQDWKQMAKSASRFSSSGSRGSDVGSGNNLDGSAWMAQRKKKIQEQEDESRRAQEERLKRQHEEKRQMRKSQMASLKEAVKKIEATSGTSSLQAAAAHAPGSPKSPSFSPVKILSRPVVSETPKAGGARHSGRDQEDSRSMQSSSTTSSYQRNHGTGRPRSGSQSSGRMGESLNDRNSNRGGRGRGRGRGRSNAAKVNVGETTIVRTPSGNIQYRITLEKEDEDKTKGELLPNGSVRLSRKKKSKAGKDGRSHHTKGPHTSIQTKLEIGAEKEK